MANWSDPNGPATVFGARTGLSTGATDAGLRSYMLSVYNYMASGVLLTGIVAMLFSRGGLESPAATVILAGGPLAWVIILAPLAFVMILSFGINRLSTPAARVLFWVYAGVMGLSMSTLLLRYTGGSVATAFFSTTVAFLGLSLYGYTTKRSLSGIGTFLIMGLFGLIGASLINLFVQSSALSFAISVIGVLVFAGLTAYDTQKIKDGYYQVAGTEFEGKSVVMGALTLYLDFVNMFLMLLRLMGGNRN